MPVGGSHIISRILGGPRDGAPLHTHPETRKGQQGLCHLPHPQWKPGASPLPTRPYKMQSPHDLPDFRSHLSPHSFSTLVTTTTHHAVPQMPYLRAFALAVSATWNNLPPDTHIDGSLASFRALLRGHYVREAFSNHPLQNNTHVSPSLSC